MPVKGEVQCADKQNDVFVLFLHNLPFDERKHARTLIIKLRKCLQERIPSTLPFKLFLSVVDEMRSIFVRTPLSIRCRLKDSIIDLLETTLNLSQEVFAIFTICLCLTELSTMRNQDRTDLECANVNTSLQRLKNHLFPSLFNRIINARINFPVLISWSYGMLVYTYRTCIFWMADQDHAIGDDNTALELDERVYDLNSMPSLLRVIFKCQDTRKPLPLPVHPYSLIDVVFASAVCNVDERLIMEKPLAEVGFTSMCTLERTEPVFMQSVQYNKITLASAMTTDFTIKEDITLDNLDDIKHILQQRGDVGEVGRLLLYLENALLSKNIKTPANRDKVLVLALQSSSWLTSRFSVPLLNNETNTPEATSAYEQIFCAILRLWIAAIDRRQILTLIPQPYIWLAGFTTSNYSLMSLRGFTQAATLKSRFLTSYLSLYRSSVLTSPHWFIYMITDLVIAIIGRVEEGSSCGEAERSVVEDSMSSLLAGVCRTWNALHADMTEMRPELSRAVKPLLDTILVRLAGIGSIKQPRPRKMSTAAAATALSARFRAQLNTGLIQPALAAIDPWALGQSRIGLKPVSARELLRQAICSSLAQGLAASAGSEPHTAHPLLRRHERMQRQAASAMGYGNKRALVGITPTARSAIAGTGRVAGAKRKYPRLH